MFDYSRYPRPDIFPVILLKVADKEFIEKIIDPLDWHKVIIIADGPNIEIKINGLTTAKFKETINVPSKGQIFLQAHADGPYEVRYKNIVLHPI